MRFLLWMVSDPTSVESETETWKVIPIRRMHGRLIRAQVATLGGMIVAVGLVVGT